MLSYFLTCKKNSENVGKKVLKTKNTRTMLSSKCIYVVVKNQDL